MLSTFSDEYFMREALKEAQLAADKGEIPVGAIIVSKNTIIARAHNLTEQLQDVTAHAEILAISAAANYLGSKYLRNCKLYISLEPCLMCSGALAWSQISQIIIGARDPKKRVEQQVYHPKTKISFGILEEEASILLRNFFKNRRRK